ncbi:MAG TPA: hypothetical protein VL442_20830 [Mucilaginibacter sp.]|nr:hypothetical protein [Mucilaginibacter sp.]
MLTSEELIKEISATMTKTKVVKLTAIIEKQQFSIKDLIDITFHPDKNIAFRAAWILENLFLQKPESYIDYLQYLISRVRDVENPSCKRHYTKILMHITAPKAPAIIKQKLTEIDLEPVVEQLFDWLIDPKILIAVKVFAAEALFNMRDQYGWIAEELCNQVRFLMKDGTAAIQSRGKKLLSRLK